MGKIHFWILTSLNRMYERNGHCLCFEEYFFKTCSLTQTTPQSEVQKQKQMTEERQSYEIKFVFSSHSLRSLTAWCFHLI